MTEVEKLAQSIKDSGKRHVKVSTAWATVKSVNWSKKTMTCTGVSDDLDYYNVLLGIGSTYVKPKKNTLVLIGIIENKEAATFLIDAEDVEELAIKCPKIVFNDGNNKGLLILDKVQYNLDAIKDYLSNLNTAIGAGFTGVGVSVGPGVVTPASGTLGKAAFDGATTALQLLFANMENPKIKH